MRPAGRLSLHSCCASCSRARSCTWCCSWRRCSLRTRRCSAPRIVPSPARGCWARTPGRGLAGAGGRIRGARNTVAAASGPLGAGPSTTRCTGPGAERAGPGVGGVTSGGEGDTTGFSVLRVLWCFWKTKHGVGGIRARLQGVLPSGKARPQRGTSLRREGHRVRLEEGPPSGEEGWGSDSMDYFQVGKTGGQTPVVGPPFAHLSRRRWGENGGHCIRPQVAHTPAPLEAGRCEVLTAQVLVAAGHPVLMAHVPQPGPQPGAILQWEPARGSGVTGSVGLWGQQYQVRSHPSLRTHTSGGPWAPDLCLPG